eukprot:TRINITY_DN8830_c0_g2_i1.p1 TRINITY_DN8830_c0_g2~~TRINITY_DN8830_c0_g2_i1.p1  ORF type:complete len:2604 (+),score=518.72 TRINITY_DN8830_c0_g2_i1:1122-7814(+)
MCVAFYLSHLWSTNVAPFIAKRVASAAVADCSTHRLAHTRRAADWWIFACAIEHPTHGVMLRWRIRGEHSHAVGFMIQIRSESGDEGPSLQRSLFVPRLKVSPAENSPNMLQYIVASTLSGGHIEPGRAYQFQLRPMSQAGLADGGLSAWTAAVRLQYPAPITDLPMVLLKTFAPAPVPSLSIFMDQLAFKDLEVYIRLEHIQLGFRPVKYDELRSQREDCILEVAWPKEAAEETETWQEVDTKALHIVTVPIAWSENWSTGNVYTFSAQKALELKLTSVSQQTLRVTLKTCGSLREVFSTSIPVKDMLRHWEDQAEGCRSEADVLRRAEAGELSRFSRKMDGYTLRFCPTFVDNDVYPEPVFKEMWCPVTPYEGSPNTWPEVHGAPQRTNEWFLSPFRSLLPSEMVMQGSRKMITWDVDLMQRSLAPEGSEVCDEATIFELQLRPAKTSDSAAHAWRTILHGLPVSRGEALWKVPVEASMDGRFVLVAVVRASGHEVVSAASVEFFVDAPMTMQAFELAYAAFCRSYQLSMEVCTADNVSRLGPAVLTTPLAVCNDLRPTIPVESSSMGKAVKVCKFKNAMMPSSRPISVPMESDAVEGQQNSDDAPGFVYRSAVQEVEVLEGASWRTGSKVRPGPAENWANDVLLANHLDMSWHLTGKLAAGAGKGTGRALQSPFWVVTRKFINGLQETLLFELQILSFCVMPSAALVAVLAQNYFQHELNPSYRQGAGFWEQASRHSHLAAFMSDFGSDSWTSVGSFLRQPPAVQVAFEMFAFYYLWMSSCIFYMTFLRGWGSPRMYRCIDWMARQASSFSVFASLIFMLVCLMWAMLACLIVSPDKNMPVAVMLASAVLTTASMASSLQKVAKQMQDLMLGLVDTLLNGCLTEFIESRPELKANSVNSDLYFFGEGWQWDKQAEEFCRVLCEHGQKMPARGDGAAMGDGSAQAVNKLTSAICRAVGADEDELAGQEEELADDADDADEDVAEADTQAEEFGLSADTRMKLDICFNYLVNKTPLPAGVENSLKDLRQLAISSFKQRDDALNRLLARGQALCKEIFRGNIERNLESALCSVLQAGPESRINVLDAEKTSQEAVLFYDKTLMELIRTHVRSRIGAKYEHLLDCAKEKSKEKAAELGLDWVDMKDSEAMPGIKVGSMQDMQRELLPLMQVLRIVRPGDLKKLQGQSHSAKSLYDLIQQITGGEPRMRREHLVQLVRRMIDTAGDGKVDQIWHGAYREYLEELYLCSPRRHIEIGAAAGIRVKWRKAVSGGLQSGQLLVESSSSHLKVPVGWTIEWLQEPGQQLKFGAELQAFDGKALPACVFCTLLENIQPNTPSHVIDPSIPKGTTDPQPNNWGYPVTAFAAEKAWDEETGDSIMMDLGRIEDVILTQLTMDAETSTRKLWPEAFVLLARYLHLWPEVPFEDAYAEIHAAEPMSQGVRSEYRNKFHFGDAEFGMSRMPTKLTCISEKYAQDQDRSSEPPAFRYFSTVVVDQGDAPMRSASHMSIDSSEMDAMADGLLFAYSLGPFSGDAVTPEPESPSAGLRRSRSSLVTPGPPGPTMGPQSQGAFKSLGSFTPYNGFSFLQTSWKSLEADNAHPQFLKRRKFRSTDPWITLVWDKDAQGDPRSPPFEGPLTVYLVFLNLDPTESEKEIHRKRPWVLDWKREESLEVPALKDGKRLWRGFERPKWAEDKPSTPPRHEVRSKSFAPNFRGENLVHLYGMNEPGGSETKPVLIFVRVMRNEFPDLNSFEDAHTAPFKRSDFFYRELWSKMDQAEAKRKAEARGVKQSSYANSWFIDLAPDGIALLRDMVMERTSPKKLAHLKIMEEGLYYDAGLNSNGVQTIWYKEHGSWSRMRGLWFDAFEELLSCIGLEMDRQAAWSLFRRFSSTKELPRVGFGSRWSKGAEPGGIIPVYLGDSTDTDSEMGIVNALEYLQNKRPFLSDTTFIEFNQLSGLNIEKSIALKLYDKMCQKTPNYAGAKNLVAWRDMEEQLREHVQVRTHQLEVVLQGEREASRFRVGGIWFEPLYNIVITCMPEVPERSEVFEIYLSYVDKRTGLCPLSKVYDVIAKLGRPGLKFEQFCSFTTRLGMHLDSETLRKCFQTVDIEQNNTLSNDEMKSGMNLLFRQIVPELILKRNSLRPEQIFFHVAVSLCILLLMFAFLELSFIALLGPNGGSKLNTVLQSLIAAVVAVGASSGQGSGKYDEKELRHGISNDLESYAGGTAKLSMGKAKMD